MKNNYENKNKEADAIKERERLINKLSQLDGNKLRMVFGFVIGLKKKENKE